jgi:metallo-beta-lactamase class B
VGSLKWGCYKFCRFQLGEKVKRAFAAVARCLDEFVSIAVVDCCTRRRLTKAFSLLILTSGFLLMATAGAQIQAAKLDDPLLRSIGGESAAQWTVPQSPVRVYGNTWLIGFTEMNVVLVDTGNGLIVVDAGVPQGVQDIEANIRSLGYELRDVKYILNTEAHYDHGGGIAALARDTGAVVVASELSAIELEQGHNSADDPQSGELSDFPAVKHVQRIKDGEHLQLGNTQVTAYATPGHTAGSMSWGWTSCARGVCFPVVFAASLSPISVEGYRFADPVHHAVVEQFRRSYEQLRKMPCEILLAGHPVFIDGAAKLKRLKADPASNAFREANACHIYADAQEKRLETRLKSEAATKSK